MPKNAVAICNNCPSHFVINYKCDTVYYKLRQVLQSAMDLLKIATSITKSDDYYKFATVRRQLGARASGAGGGAEIKYSYRNVKNKSKGPGLQTTPFCFITW